MKKGFKKWLVALCSIVLLGSSMGVTAQAEGNGEWIIGEYQEFTGENVAYGIHNGVYNLSENSNARGPLLFGCEMGIYVDEEGAHINLSTSATETATELGVKDVYLEYQDSWGIWHRVNQKPYYAGRTNDNHFAIGLIYKGAQKGVFYRVKGVHYAYLSDGYHSLENETKGIRY